MLSQFQRMCRFFFPILSFILLFGCSRDNKEQKLFLALGDFPPRPALDIDTLETVKLPKGFRYKIEFTVEKEDTLFDRPVDKVRAYLFVPEHDKNEKLPAIVAIHQDGPNTHLGKAEPAGIDGDPDQFYGVELFERGYVVIVPDRFPHAERRRIPKPETAGSDMMRDLNLWLRWSGQLILKGRTYFGKEVYDLMCDVDVLETYDFVDHTKIGAIGHSAGGNVLVYFMFVDKRIQVGVSSCGFFDLIGKFNDNDVSFANSVFALPGLAKIGKSADYLALIAPRPFLMTRGLNEMSNEEDSKKHVQETKAIENYVRAYYKKLNSSDNLKTIYFDGGHTFPSEIREKAYNWLDKYLKR